MKHTPGEWEVSFGELDGSGEFAVYQGETGTICRGDNEMVAWKANARLLAAAPELLEAAKFWLSSYKENGPCITDAAKILRAAIRKAEGL